MPEVSVLMPSYNHEQYIGEAIESILNQTFTDLELIIVDDASTDNSRQVIESYQKQDPRVQASFRETNAYYTTDEAFDRSSGRFIGICDSDDLWVDTKLEKQLAVLQDDENKVVLGEGVSIDTTGNIISLMFSDQESRAFAKLKRSGDIFDCLLQNAGPYFSKQTMLVKREHFVKFDTRYQYIMEYKLLLELARRYEFHFLNEIIYKRRIHPTNSCVNAYHNQEKVEQERAMIAREYLEPYRDRLSPPTRITLCQQIIGNALKQNDLAEVRHHFLLLLDAAPAMRENLLANHQDPTHPLDLNIALDERGTIRFNLAQVGVSYGDLLGAQTQLTH